MIEYKVFCDICNEQAKEDDEFACNIDVQEIKHILLDKGVPAPSRTEKRKLQVCKGCFYKFFNAKFKADFYENYEKENKGKQS